MPTVTSNKKIRRALSVAVVTATSTCLSMTNAFAGMGGGSGGSAGGSSDGRHLAASVRSPGTRVKVTVSSKSGGRLASTSAAWTPPLCWYEPVATPKQLKAAVKGIEDGKDVVPVGANGWGWGIKLMHQAFRDGKALDGEGYEDYNLKQQGKGMFWRGVVNPNRRSEYDSHEWTGYGGCGKRMFWASDGTTPNADAISPERLAAYAYDSVRVPDTSFELNPSGRQTVNLPTWIWQDKAVFTKATARAVLPGTGMWAETTAEPVGLRLDPGTSNATVHPSSGTCPISADGSVGKPYHKGDKGSPPCGVVYRHASTNGPFTLKATVTWRITWRGGDGRKPGHGSFPDGTFGTNKDVDVQERCRVSSPAPAEFARGDTFFERRGTRRAITDRRRGCGRRNHTARFGV